MISSHERRLVRESEWLRVFQVGDEEAYVYESKFLVDDLEVSLSTVKEKWPGLSLDEKVEFSLAFSCHEPSKGEDQRILEFLMEVGPEEVWKTIAIVVPFHPRADVAVKFLLERIKETRGSRANYFQGIELLRREESIRVLRKYYDEYGKVVTGEMNGRDEVIQWMDYLQCAKTLWTLTQEPMFLSALRDGQAKTPEGLRSYAKNLLRKTENP